MLEIVRLILGPVQTNTYLLADPASGEAAVIDPAWDGRTILAEAQRRRWHIGSLWLTHAHFDHFGGAADLAAGLTPTPLVGLHPKEHSLYRLLGGAPLFGIHIDPGPRPTLDLFNGQQLHLGSNLFEIRHCPGHSPGHIILVCATEKLVFCGDVIFQSSIGRTDLPGGSQATLLNSIRRQVLSLPDDFRLLCGHGPETTVGIERHYNPFLG